MPKKVAKKPKVKDCRPKSSQRPGPGNVLQRGRRFQYTDGLTKQQRQKLRLKGLLPQIVPKPIKVGRTKTATIALPIQQIRANYGAEPPASLKNIFLPCAQSCRLQALARRVLEALAESKLPYMLDGGTLLGWARMQTLLPWDDDLDISIPAEKVADLKEIDWQTYGLSLAHGDLPGLWKLFFCDRHGSDLDLVSHLNGRVISGTKKAYRWPFLDVFEMRKDSRRQRHYVGKTKQMFPGFAMDADFTTRKATLHLQGQSLQTRVPRRYQSYLSAGYGPRWRTVAKLPDYDHRQSRMINRSPACKAASYKVGGEWSLKVMKNLIILIRDVFIFVVFITICAESCYCCL